MVYFKISVSPGTIEIITQTGLPAAVQPVLTGVPAAMPSRAASSDLGMPAMITSMS